MEEICKFTSLLPSEKNEGWNSPAQRGIFIELFKIPFIADNFWLAGGTCLSAMYLGHRRSDDIDLFTTCKEIHPSTGVKITDILRGEFEFDMPTVVNPNFASMLINGTKVEFVADMFAHKCKRPEITLDNVVCKVDSWDNLCVAKFSAFLSRTSDKDISDLGAILKTAKDDGEFRDMANFLIYETRKRDSMADELTNIYEISLYASKNTKNLSYKDVLQRFAWLVLEFQKEITQEVENGSKSNDLERDGYTAFLSASKRYVFEVIKLGTKTSEVREPGQNAILTVYTELLRRPTESEVTTAKDHAKQAKIQVSQTQNQRKQERGKIFER